MAEPTQLTVNGRRVSLDAAPSTPLLLALRNDLDLRGARTGCAVGECGACTVLLDGEPIRSCDTPLEIAAGKDVTTPEGLGTPEAPGPVQQAFLDETAAQCGYCINGMIMTVAGLAQRPSCSEEELCAALDELICRCGTHPRVLRAAREVLGLPQPETSGPSTPDPGGEVSDHWSPPAILEDYPDVADWLRLSDEGRVEVLTGKVEIGQGIRTAMGQIAASQIGVDAGLVDVLPSATAHAPDEGQTAGSHSVDQGGTAVGSAAVAFRRLLLERAAERLGGDAARLDIAGAEVRADDGRVSFAELAAQGQVTGKVLPDDEPDWTLPPLGGDAVRTDLRRKLTGAPAYVHDLALPGMLHARALLPPTYAAAPRGLDPAEVEAMDGVVDVVVEGRLVIAVAEREEQALRARNRLAQQVTWDDPGLPDVGQAPEAFRELPSEPYVAVEADAPLTAPAATATYRLPYQSHAPIAPSCAVAEADGDRLRIWTHTQGIHPLRRELAALLGEDVAALELIHADGPGCYGQTLSDDAAAMAAIASRAVGGRPVRFLFTVEDEFGWDSYGAPVLAELAAELDDDGRVSAWRHHVISETHTNRPDGSGRTLIAAWLREEEHDRPWTGPHEGGIRNAEPLYDLPSVDVRGEYVKGPLRTSALRTLGAYANVFAAESFMDELAEAAGADPLAFRLAHLTDAEARRCLEVAAEEIGWQERVGPSGRGLGIAVARYKNDKAVVAQAVRASLDPESGELSVAEVVTVGHAGAVIDHDGLVNQLDGGTLQGLSRTIHERVEYDRRGVHSRDWGSYPVLRFRHVPRLRTIVLETPGSQPRGAGEASMPPAAAAVANAVDDAIGIRLRDLPFRPESVQERLFEMTDEEAARVLLD